MNEEKRFALSDDELRGIFDGENNAVPQKIIEEVTPWKTAMIQILLGFGFSAVVIEIFPLNVILPAIGSLLSLLGFRSLRKENRAFSFGYALSIVFFVLEYSELILRAAAIYNDIVQSAPFQIISRVILFLRLFEILAIVLGVETVRKKAGEEKRTKGWTLIIWYGIILFLASINYTGMLLGWVVIIAYVAMIIRLYKFSSSLKLAGFAIKPAKVRIGNKMFSAATAVLLVLSIVGVNLFFGTYPMKYEKRADKTSTEISAVKSELSELGFPKNVLDDLSNETILECKGAKKVVVNEAEASIFDRTKTVTDKNGETKQEEIKDIGFVSVAVLVQGEDIEAEYTDEEFYDDELKVPQQWKIIHWFKRLDKVGGSSVDCIEILPAYSGSKNWKGLTVGNGRLLFEKDGESFVGEYRSIKEDNPQSDFSFLAGYEQNSLVYAEFSPPKNCENFRGYFSYDIFGDINKTFINSVITYYAGYDFPNYPASSAKEYVLKKNTRLLRNRDTFIPRAVEQLMF